MPKPQTSNPIIIPKTKTQGDSNSLNPEPPKSEIHFLYLSLSRARSLSLLQSLQVDGENDTWDATHMWLAPYSRAKPTCIHFVFEEVVYLPYIYLYYIIYLCNYIYLYYIISISIIQNTYLCIHLSVRWMHR